MKLILSFLFFTTLSQPFSYAQSTSSDVVYLSKEENQFYQIINQFRSQLGLPTVQIHVMLQSAAKKHSEWMATQDFLTHFGPTENKTPFERMIEEGYSEYTSMGENVACGNADAVKTFRQWAFSPGHLINMINPHYQHIGIARAGTGNENCPYYWTNDFGSMNDPRQDPPSVKDIFRIKRAIEAVSGAIPADKKVQLPTVEQSDSSSTKSEYSEFQCIIPSILAKNIFTFSNKTDAVLEVTPNNQGSYKAKVNYIQNGASANIAPYLINQVSVVKNLNYPLVMIYGNGFARNSNFIIQLDTNKNTAQFDSFPANTTAGRTISCSYKN